MNPNESASTPKSPADGLQNKSLEPLAEENKAETPDKPAADEPVAGAPVVEVPETDSRVLATVDDEAPKVPDSERCVTVRTLQHVDVDDEPVLPGKTIEVNARVANVLVSSKRAELIKD